MKKLPIFLLLFCSLILGVVGAGDITADEIMDKVRDNRFPPNSKALIKMTLIDKNGKKLVKEFAMYRKVSDTEAKTFIEFDNPPSIRGTRFLVLQKGAEEKTYAKFTENPNVQSISEGQKSDRFMGSDFTYGDLKIDRKGEDNFELLGKETFKTYQCYVIKSTAKNAKTSQYSNLKIWVDAEKFAVRHIDFTDKKKNKKIKTLDVEKIELIENKWTAVVSVMTDLRDNHKTEMNIAEVKFNVRLDDSMFSIRTLLKGM